MQAHSKASKARGLRRDYSSRGLGVGGASACFTVTMTGRRSEEEAFSAEAERVRRRRRERGSMAGTQEGAVHSIRPLWGDLGVALQ